MMGLTIVALDKYENFLQFLDPELCSITEEIEYGAYRSISFSYKFQDLTEDKDLFKVGNKIWIQGDTNLQDCLYVINTPVKVDIYNENEFTFDAEEVLVELNYAPVFSQTELTSATFRKHNTNDAVEVYCNWNALNYWFGDYFNIGVVQKCLSENASKVTISGTVNRMELLRQIEEETGNVFVTRYEKDCLDNSIHRYLDFLNPINSSKDWNLTLQYDFQSLETLAPCVDDQGNETTEDKDWEVTPFEDGIDPESIEEDTDPYDETQEHDTERNYNWIPDDETVEDYYTRDYKTLININPAACRFEICNNDDQVLNTDGEIYQNGDTALSWEFNEYDIDPTENLNYIITLARIGDTLGIDIGNTSYAVSGIENDVTEQKPYLDKLQNAEDEWEHPSIIISVSDDTELDNVVIPDDSYLEIYDYSTDTVLFKTCLNTAIGKVHEEVLDFGFNLENIEYEIDETETYSAISPVIKVSDSNDKRNGLNRSDINTIINNWYNLSVTKGEIVPMIVEKVNVTASSLSAAISSLGTYNVHTNYWARPLKPQDNTDSDEKTYEFYRATAYWRAPYTKNAKEYHVTSTKADIAREYNEVITRNDKRNERGAQAIPKMGNTETTDENKYAIFNQVCLYLQEHESPEINIDVDVANLIGHEYNNYDIHDKVYIKMPNTKELMTARVTKTSKEAHDIAKNTITIDNYKTLNTIKTISYETYIDANNINFKYPKSKNLTVKLVNLDYDPLEDMTQYPANKLLSFTLYKIENGSQTFTGKTYTKITDAYGNATISLKLDPGDYEVEINFYGDEEYLDTTHTIEVNVGGTLPQATTTATTTTQSKTAKTNKTTKTVKTYWTKCGLSPDKKHKEVVAIAKPSSADANKYSYRWYKTVFKNYCPNCGKKGYLRFDGGKSTKCITSQKDGLGYKPSVQHEKEITCVHCDSDYCGVTGQEKSHGHVSRLKVVTKPKKAKESDLNKLIKGKLQYGTKTVTVKSKNNTNTKTRKVRASGINSTVKQKAQSIAKNKTGAAAAKAIVKWFDKHIRYADYPNFQRSPKTVLSKGSANCCDGTRALLQMLDAAGCSEYYKMYYVHVPGHVYAQLVTKKTGKKRYLDQASDYYGAWGYICKNYRGRSQTFSRYPKLPF